MDPVSSVIGGAKVAQGRFSLYIVMQLTSVLAPGITVIVGGYLFASMVGHFEPLAGFGHLAGLLSVMLAIAALAGGYVLGYLTRELMFKLLGQLEKLPRLRRRLAEDPYERLAKFFGAEIYIDFLECHPYLKHLEESRSRAATPEAFMALSGGAHLDTPQFEEFIYAKLWLRNYASGFSVDANEAEINILVATVFPVGVGILDLVAVLDFRWWVILLGVAGALLVWVLIFDSLLRLRRTERWEALRNLILDFLMRKAAAKYPSTGQGESTLDPSI